MRSERNARMETWSPRPSHVRTSFQLALLLCLLLHSSSRSRTFSYQSFAFHRCWRLTSYSNRLCNACGLRFAKRKKRRQEIEMRVSEVVGANVNPGTVLTEASLKRPRGRPKLDRTNLLLSAPPPVPMPALKNEASQQQDPNSRGI